MKILSQITPAETKLIIHSNLVDLKGLMKLTFMDLLLKKVIEIEVVQRKSHPRDAYTREYTYVVSGKNFDKYSPKKHELVFLSPFLKSPDIQILFKSFIKTVYDESKGSWNYKKSVRNTSELKVYFKSTFFHNLFRRIQLTTEGNKLKKELTNYLTDLDVDITNIMNNDKEKALELLQNLKGNIFLLKNLDFELLKKIDTELSNQQKKNYSDTSGDYDDDSWLYLFDNEDHRYDSYFDDFNDTIDSFDSDSSGCSSFDSGCSSCSGCGGCD